MSEWRMCRLSWMSPMRILSILSCFHSGGERLHGSCYRPLSPAFTAEMKLGGERPSKNIITLNRSMCVRALISVSVWVEYKALLMSALMSGLGRIWYYILRWSILYQSKQHELAAYHLGANLHFLVNNLHPNISTCKQIPHILMTEEQFKFIIQQVPMQHY